MRQNLTHVLLPPDSRTLEDVRRNYPAGRVERITNGVDVFYCYVVPAFSEKGLRSIPVRRNGRFMNQSLEDLHGVICSGGIRLDLDKELVWINGEMLHLPGAELLLLKILLLNDTSCISRRILLTILERKTGKMMQDNTLSVHIARLRKALGIHEGKSYIATEPGKGYRWAFPVMKKL